MFKKLSTPQHSGDTTLIAAECQINGSISINGNARIDGNIEGTIQATGDLMIGATAYLKADIEAATVCIAGEVHGNIKTTDLLELNSTARLYGDISTRQFKVDQGAQFTGRSQLLEEPAPPLIVHETGKESRPAKESKKASSRA
ncbi:Integral membrane protein CcmA involved in cell shape determination [Desulfosporosinus orientis DSM 765]|uniref:Integral membrane protein CcmA involved in cell shape determination n=1 Tax=Desulfosporosinus orientis (strain ATCC 19365 / DSM 765 / NCIMB 8382 / VKM B-1628 / Singapore I) TaxID=768706 RepID=G7WC00_DESOD|nr:polymer-forming cytoskeletal protein [Desulfosporosinus orientis]AET69974.1 Integral membrane protein CcmA involved in cell shape determination [Desulfosporosinus orientis DSM 765]